MNLKRNLLKTLLILLIMLLLTSCDNEISVDNDSIPDSTGENIEIEIGLDKYDSAIGNISPIFSNSGGIYSSSLSISLQLPDDSPNYEIRYTLNGNEPVKTSELYTSPIEILGNKNSVVIRAACFDINGNITGNIITNTYLKAEDGRYTVDIICVTSDSKNLTGSNGIISNPTKSGKEWERPAHIEYIQLTDNGYDILINSDAGLRIFGGSSRTLEQKSFRIIARNSDYFDADGIKYNGMGNFKINLFENRTVLGGTNIGEMLGRYDKFIIRNGGNDSLQAVAADPLQMNLLRDSTANLFLSQVSDNVCYQDSKFVTVYLNGEYYGILDMKEYIDDKYIENLYGLSDKNDVVIIKSELDTTRSCSSHSNGGECRFCDVWFYYDEDEVNSDDIGEFITMCEKAINANDSTRDEIYMEIMENYIDIDNFVEYTVYYLYICNTDWPHNNIRIWRYIGAKDDNIPITDGKFRFAARDMDFAFGRYENYVLPEIYTLADTDTFMRTLGNYISGSYNYDKSSGFYPDSLYLQGLLDFCLRNDEFRNKFESYCKYLATDENKESLKKIIISQAESIESEMEYHLKKWKSSINSKYDINNWNEQVQAMLNWADERNEYFINQLENILQYYQDISN